MLVQFLNWLMYNYAHMKVTWLIFCTPMLQLPSYLVNKFDQSVETKIMSWYTAAVIIIVVIITSHFNLCALVAMFGSFNFHYKLKIEYRVKFIFQHETKLIWHPNCILYVWFVQFDNGFSIYLMTVYSIFNCFWKLKTECYRVKFTFHDACTQLVGIHFSVLKKYWTSILNTNIMTMDWILAAKLIIQHPTLIL